MATHAATGGQANLGRIRTEVARALEHFLALQRHALAAIGDDLLPCLDAMEGLLAGGKRLRPAFCYWGWRAAGGDDCPEIFAAASALELLQASALVHDDVMDASDTRRGKPAVHRQFGSRFAAGKLGPTGIFRSAAGPGAGDWTGSAGRPGSTRAGSAEQFGIGAAILVGDMLLAWTDELYHS